MPAYSSLFGLLECPVSFDSCIGQGTILWNYYTRRRAAKNEHQSKRTVARSAMFICNPMITGGDAIRLSRPTERG